MPHAGRPVGHGRHAGRHRAVLDRGRVRAGREVRRHVEPASTRCSWSATTCSTPAATSASTWASTSSPTEIVEELLDGVVAQVEREVPWRPGARRAAGRAARGRRAVRAGDDVLPAVRGADPGHAARRRRSRVGGHRRRRSSAASRTPSPTSRRPRRSASTRPSAWPSRTPTPAPGRRRRPAARCCASPNHVPVLAGRAAGLRRRRWRGSGGLPAARVSHADRERRPRSPAIVARSRPHRDHAVMDPHPCQRLCSADERARSEWGSARHIRRTTRG